MPSYFVVFLLSLQKLRKEKIGRGDVFKRKPLKPFVIEFREKHREETRSH